MSGSVVVQSSRVKTPDGRVVGRRICPIACHACAVAVVDAWLPPNHANTLRDPGLDPQHGTDVKRLLKRLPAREPPPTASRLRNRPVGSPSERPISPPRERTTGSRSPCWEVYVINNLPGT